MRVISRSRLRSFWEEHPDSEASLRAWYKVVEHATWDTPEAVKEAFRTADILKNGRAVFNVRETRYRIVVKLHYNTGKVYIRFVGTHQEYEDVDADTI